MTDRRKSESGYPEWATPKHIWKPLGDALGGFDLDPASGAEPEPIATTRYTQEEDGLNRRWFGDVWLNYPYGRQEHPEWTAKVAQEARQDRTDSITVLAPASTDTSWFQANLADGDLLTFVDGRISFLGAGDSTDDVAAFSSVLVSFFDYAIPEGYEDVLTQIGFVTEPQKDRKYRQKTLADGRDSSRGEGEGLGGES